MNWKRDSKATDLFGKVLCNFDRDMTARNNKEIMVAKLNESLEALSSCTSERSHAQFALIGTQSPGISPLPIDSYQEMAQSIPAQSHTAT